MKLYNIVKVYTSTVGTGTVTLGSAVPSFITFATAGVVNGSTVSYAIEDGNNREVGTGTYTSGAETLTRSVATSTNSNNLITLSGNAVVFITGLAADLSSDTANVASTLVQRDASGNFAAGAATLSSAVVPLIIGGTGTTSTLTLRSTSGVGTTGADIIFQTGNNGATEVMRLQNSGNVGIGRSPVYKFDVNGVVSRSGDTGTASYLQIGANATDLNNYLIGCETGSFVFYQGRYGGSASERMRIDSSGRVGIALVPTTSALEVNGEMAAINAFASLRLMQTVTGTGYRWALNNDGTLRLQYTTNAFSTASIPILIDSSGNVGIGTGSTIRSILNTHVGTITGPAVTAGLTLTAFYSGVTAVNSIDWNYSGQTASPVRLGATFNSDGSGMEMVFYTSTAYTVTGSERMRINKDGNVGIGTSSPSRTLDVNGSCVFGNVVGVVAGDSTPAQIGILTFGQSTASTYAWIQSWSSRPLAINPSGNNVGIGTSGPSQKLHVVGSILATSSTWGSSGSSSLFLGDTNNYIKTTFGGTTDIASYNSMTFITGPTPAERMRIDSSGNVGIGAVSTAARLHVSGGGGWSSSNFGKQLYITTPTNSSNPSIGISDATGGNNWAITNSGGALFFSQMPAITDGSTGPSTRMAIDSSGNVGIGTASNAGNTLRYLDVQNTDTGSSAGAILRLITSNSAGTSANSVDMVRYKTGLFVINNNDSSGIITINNAGSECMRINSNGNVGIGATTVDALFHVSSGVTTSTNLARIYAGSLASGNAVDMYIGKAASSNQSGSFGFHYNSTSTSSYAYMSIYGDSATTGITVTPGGKVGIGKQQSTYSLEISADSAAKPGAGGLWTVVSDERIKTNIIPADLDRCYEIVKSVPLKHYGFAPGVYGENQIQDKHNLGWIAQDVQKVFKNAVSTKPFTLHNNEVIQDCLDLNSGQLIAALYGAVQSLMQKVEELQRKI